MCARACVCVCARVRVCARALSPTCVSVQLCVCVSTRAQSDSLRPHGLPLARLLCPRILERVALSSSRGPCPPRDRIRLSCTSRVARRAFLPLASRGSCPRELLGLSGMGQGALCWPVRPRLEKRWVIEEAGFLCLGPPRRCPPHPAKGLSGGRTQTDPEHGPREGPGRGVPGTL